MNQVYNTLSKDAFWNVNKAIAKHLKSNDAALVLSELLFVHKQHEKKDQVFISLERLMENCNLNRNALRTALKTLYDNNLIFIEKKGMPARNYYKVFQPNIVKIWDKYTSNDKSLDSLTTSDEVITSDENIHHKSSENSSHNNKVDIKKVDIKKVDMGLDIKDIPIDKNSMDNNYIISQSENKLTNEQRNIKAQLMF